MLACAQILEKLPLIIPEETRLTRDMMIEQLHDQCDYQLYELAEACLSGAREKVIHLLRLARQNKTEPTLILWLITQEIRQLIQLDHMRKQSLPLSKACMQLKIWPQRVRLYETTLIRVSQITLQQLLIKSQNLDVNIKSNQSQIFWHDLEQLALALC
jgi:DNA polymerase-3 subunit delta